MLVQVGLRNGQNCHGLFAEGVKKMNGRDVLVTVMTDTDYTPFIGKSCAIVTNTGGLPMPRGHLIRELEKESINPEDFEGGLSKRPFGLGGGSSKNPCRQRPCDENELMRPVSEGVNFKAT